MKEKSPFAHGLTAFHFANVDKVSRSECNRAIKRLIKRKQDYLGKQCRRIFLITNRLGESFLFSRFTAKGARGKDGTMVTLASYIPHVGWISSK